MSLIKNTRVRSLFLTEQAENVLSCGAGEELENRGGFQSNPAVLFRQPQSYQLWSQLLRFYSAEKITHKGKTGDAAVFQPDMCLHHAAALNAFFANEGAGGRGAVVPVPGGIAFRFQLIDR